MGQGTLGPEFAIPLLKVLADALGLLVERVTERAALARLTHTLAKELARHMTDILRAGIAVCSGSRLRGGRGAAARRGLGAELARKLIFAGSALTQFSDCG